MKAEIESAQAQLAAYLRERGLKITRERMAVLREALAFEGHFEAEDLQVALRRGGRRVSRATIYRTIKLLLDANLLRRSFSSVGKQTYYENLLDSRRHEHLICVRCGRVIEFTSDFLEEALKKEASARGFQFKRLRIEIFGECANCSTAPDG